MLVVDNNDIQNLAFPESELVGVAYLNSFLPPAEYRQTSYNRNFRAHYAGIGDTFIPTWGEYGGFCPPPPYASWVLNQSTLVWEPPVPYPVGAPDVLYKWDEDTVSWVVVEVGA